MNELTNEGTKDGWNEKIIKRKKIDCKKNNLHDRMNERTNKQTKEKKD